MKKTKFLTLLSILALVACGGGGGSKGPDTTTWTEDQKAVYEQKTTKHSDLTVQVISNYDTSGTHQLTNYRGPRKGKENFIKLFTLELNVSPNDDFIFSVTDNNETKLIHPVPDYKYDYGFGTQNNLDLDTSLHLKSRVGGLDLTLVVAQYDYFYLAYLSGYDISGGGGAEPYNADEQFTVLIPETGFTGTTPKYPKDDDDDPPLPPDPPIGGEGEWPPEGGIPNWPTSSTRRYTKQRQVVTYQITGDEECIVDQLKGSWEDSDETTDGEYEPLGYDYISILWAMDHLAVSGKTATSSTYTIGDDGSLTIKATFPAASNYDPDSGDEMRVISDYLRIEHYYDAYGFITKRVREFRNHDYCWTHTTFGDATVVETTTYTYS